MSRAAARQNVGVALFPFLAVLICTMGALIVLLVLLVQQARVDASTLAAQQVAAPDDSKLRERLEDARWRREMLETSRAEKTAELANSRGKLAHLEEHLQRLQERAKELIERAKLIDDGAQLQADDLTRVREELARVQGEIEQQKKKVEAAKRSAASESWYALIPYDGPQGTRRRPIYLECTDQGVVLQPEGLVLRAQDFQGPLGPGNPLDAALRMIRAHLEQMHGKQAGQPYPLVVVRPSGVGAYGAARAALKSWDDEFGYELIGDDKRLDFGAPDPALAASLERTVAVARQKQAAMAAMMPRSFQHEEPLQSFDVEPPASAASPSAGGGGLGAGNSGFGSPGTGARVGSGTGSSIARNGASPGGTYGNGAYGANTPSGAAPGANLPGSGNSGTPGSGPGGMAPSRGMGTASAGSPPTGPTLGSPAGDSLTNNASGGTGPSTGNLAGASSGNTSGPAGPPAGTPGGAGGGGALGGSRAGATPIPNLPLGQAGSNASGSSGSSSGAAKSGGTKSGKTRGRNWALTGAKPHAIGVTRPLRVGVQADRLVIVPERGDSRAPVVVPISPELRPDDIEHFVTAVQKEIQGWGLAVANGYWKPVLQVDVAAGAEPQFSALQAALDGSGFDLVRRQP